MTQLFESEVFCHQFELVDWPIIHHDDTSLIVPYNGSKFALSGGYSQVFADFVDKHDNCTPEPKKKFFKIKYTLNVLPAVTYRDGQRCGVSDLLT